MTRSPPSTPPPRPPSAPPPENCTYPPSAPNRTAWPRSRSGNDATHLGYLAEVLCAEVDDRGSQRRRSRRISEARFPRLKRLVPVQCRCRGHHRPGHPGPPRHRRLHDRRRARRVARRFRHRQVPPAHRPRRRRLRTRPIGALHHHRTTGQRTRRGRRRPSNCPEWSDATAASTCFCLDELGYVQIDPRGAELLFQIITEREERASIAIATNLPFSEWGTVFPDPRLVAAIVDRVTFNAHVLQTGTQSYRLRTSKTTNRRNRRTS